jgi:hypothetical protein
MNKIVNEIERNNSPNFSRFLDNWTRKRSNKTYDESSRIEVYR